MQINVKLDKKKEGHAEIIEFLEDAPKTWIIIEALKMYINNYKSMQNPKRVSADTKEADEIPF